MTAIPVNGKDLSEKTRLLKRTKVIIFLIPDNQQKKHEALWRLFMLIANGLCGHSKLFFTEAAPI